MAVLYGKQLPGDLEKDRVYYGGRLMKRPRSTERRNTNKRLMDADGTVSTGRTAIGSFIGTRRSSSGVPCLAMHIIVKTS